jgi:hypothetical protein
MTMIARDQADNELAASNQVTVIPTDHHIYLPLIP